MSIPQSDPVVVAPTPTPFNDQNRVDLNSMARNIERWMDTPLSGFVLGTANGEESVLDESEKVSIVNAVSQVAGQERLIIAGIDNPSENDTLRQADRYADAGADLVRIRIPRGVSAEEVSDYFHYVVPRCPLPVVVIHQSFGTGPSAPPDTIGTICQLENVYGYITDHDVRFESRVRQRVPDDRKFWICNGGLLLYGMLMGANGACMWLGNVAPGLSVDIVTSGYRGIFQEARDMQVTATYLDEAIGQHGVAGVKAALESQGFEGMRPRPPRQPLDHQARAGLQFVLRETGLA